MACDQQSTEPLPHLGALVINMSLITGMSGTGSGAAAESGKSISKLRCIGCWDDMLPMMGLWFVVLWICFCCVKVAHSRFSLSHVTRASF